MDGVRDRRELKGTSRYGRIIYTTMTGANAAHRQSVLATTYQCVHQRLSGRDVHLPLGADAGATAPPPACSRWKPRQVTSAPLAQPRPPGAAWTPWPWAAPGLPMQGSDGLGAYARAGSFNVSAAGQLVTPSGLPVLSDGGAPIDIPQGAEVTWAPTAPSPQCRRPVPAAVGWPCWLPTAKTRSSAQRRRAVSHRLG